MITRRSAPSTEPHRAGASPASDHAAQDIECEVIPGLESLAAEELSRRFGEAIDAIDVAYGSVRARYRGDLPVLLALQLPVAVYGIQYHAVPRPRALLGQQHLQHVLDALDAVGRLHPAHSFASFRLSAAGRDSAVLGRLIAAIAEHTGLPHDAEAGDLFLRLRPATTQAGGWELLIRLSPRPLSARPWRVRNHPGALHATLAAAMVALADPLPGDRVFNPLCGSGTLLVERLRRCPAAEAVGCDIDGPALSAARANVHAAGLASHVTVTEADARRLPFEDGSFDVIYADLPWGQLVGSHRENETLYPEVLAEITRVAAPAARLALITQEPRLLERTLDALPQWSLRRQLRISHTGTHPRIYVLHRAP